jgi:putative CocE/NonD family hydrolase
MRYREGYDREVNMVKNDVYKVRINLWPTSNLFKKGHKLRLDISSSNFPRFDLNPNTGQAMGKHTSLIKATNTVWTGGDYPSKIKIPVVRNL